MGKPTERQLREFEKARKKAKEMGLGDMFMDKKHATRTSTEQKELFRKGKSKLDGVNKLSKHQTGTAFDAYFKGVTSGEEQKRRLKKLKDAAKSEGVDYGQIPWDMGHFEFEVPKEEIIEAKSKYLFGSPKMKERQTEQRIPFPRPKEDAASRMIQSVNQAVNQETERADVTARVASTDNGRKFIKNSIDQQVSKGQMNPYVGNQISSEIAKDPSSIIVARQQAVQKTDKNEKSSIKDSFMEALTFFLPQVGGMVVGGLIDGTEGAIAGGMEGERLGASFREYKFKKQEMEGKTSTDPLELERLDISKKNLEARQQQLKLEQQRAEGLDEERDERRYERSQDRVLKQKEQFTKQADVQKSIEQLRQIKDLENLAEVKVLPGTIGFKIAKGIAGEVGNLTEEERAASQIAPSVVNKLKRYAAAEFKGEIPESDIKLIKEVGAKLKKKVKNGLRDRATKFASSRSKNLHEAHAATFRDDILLDIGIDPQGDASKSVKNVSAEKQLEIIKRIKANRGK